MGRDKYYVRPREFTCAKKFLDTLDETNDLWRSGKWLYRGQNIDKTLLPSALRTPPPEFIENRFGPLLRQDPGKVLENANVPKGIAERCTNTIQSFQNDERHAVLIRRFLEKHGRQLRDEQSERQLESLHFRVFYSNYILTTFYSLAERYMVRAFVELADQVGLVVPPDLTVSKWNRPYRFLDQITASPDFGEDPNLMSTEEYTSVAFALAQHHQVPTRLLDFTFRPLIAAFFAAYFDNEPKQFDPSRRLVVWAVNVSRLPKPELRMVKRRRSEIGFLQSQDGAFLIDTKANEKYWFEGNWMPFEYYLKDLVDSKMAYKFSLPICERDKLLERLHLKGVSMPALMPSFDNVRRQILDNRFDIQGFVVGEA